MESSSSSKGIADVDAYDVLFEDSGPLGLDLESSSDGNDAYVVKSTIKNNIMVCFLVYLFIFIIIIMNYIDIYIYISISIIHILIFVLLRSCNSNFFVFLTCKTMMKKVVCIICININIYI